MKIFIFKPRKKIILATTIIVLLMALYIMVKGVNQPSLIPPSPTPEVTPGIFPEASPKLKYKEYIKQININTPLDFDI